MQSVGDSMLDRIQFSRNPITEPPTRDEKLRVAPSKLKSGPIVSTPSVKKVTQKH